MCFRRELRDERIEDNGPQTTDNVSVVCPTNPRRQAEIFHTIMLESRIFRLVYFEKYENRSFSFKNGFS